MIDISVKKKISPDFELDFTHVEKNSSLVLMGPSGCGKTTLLRSVAGLVRPDEGSICIGERVFFDPARGISLTPQARSTGYLFQEGRLFPHLTGLKNIIYGLDKKEQKQILKLSSIAGSKELELIVKTLEIEDMLNKRPATMSGGQQQRVALARAIMTRPDILLLDEPFSSLDYILKRSLRRYIDRIIPEIVPRMILVTHDINDAQLSNASIVEMRNGSVKEVVQSVKPGIKVNFKSDQKISF